MPTAPEPRYEATISITRTIDKPAEMNSRGYPEGGKPAHTEVRNFEVPAVRATDLDRLREKVSQYMDMVSDEDFGDVPRVTRGQ